MTDEKVLCHCGRPLHYRRDEDRSRIERFVRQLGPYVTVTVEGRSWRVQRHYVALHGLKAWELPDLGFEEIPIS